MNWRWEFAEAAAMAVDAMRANAMRSALATLGIVIGIVTVTLMGTAIEGLDRAFRQGISVLGSDVLYVQRFGWFIESIEEWIQSERRRPITLDDARRLQRQMVLARAVAPVAETRQQVTYQTRGAEGVTVIGTTDQFILTGGKTLAEGRFFNLAESEGGRPVCVLGSLVASNLFVREPPLGARLRIGTQSFEVIGVLEKQGSFLGAFSLDNQVVVPMSQFVTAFRHWPDYQIQVRAVSMERLSDAREELRGVMRKIRRLRAKDPDDFSIDQQDGFIQTFNRVSATIGSLGLFITGLALFVGGIGIMNIMFVSVAERTREIGLRKAVGAKRRAILTQFLLEAAMICVGGGMVGIAIAYPLTLAVSRILPARMSWRVLLAALTVSALTGLLAGLVPAWRASRLDPVEALRNE
jgi:putative ABC transport system permease protein